MWLNTVCTRWPEGACSAVRAPWKVSGRCCIYYITPQLTAFLCLCVVWTRQCRNVLARHNGKNTSCWTERHLICRNMKERQSVEEHRWYDYSQRKNPGLMVWICSFIPQQQDVSNRIFLFVFCSWTSFSAAVFVWKDLFTHCYSTDCRWQPIITRRVSRSFGTKSAFGDVVHDTLSVRLCCCRVVWTLKLNISFSFP